MSLITMSAPPPPRFILFNLKRIKKALSFWWVPHAHPNHLLDVSSAYGNWLPGLSAYFHVTVTCNRPTWKKKKKKKKKNPKPRSTALGLPSCFFFPPFQSGMILTGSILRSTKSRNQYFMPSGSLISLFFKRLTKIYLILNTHKLWAAKIQFRAE